MSEHERTFGPAAATFLSTEHWYLLGTRSMGWTEAFSRATVFLTTLSASAVALALVADATRFGDAFGWFALVLFPVVLFLGVTTYVRLVRINVADIYIVLAMNRLRRAYVDIAPEIEPYLTSGYTDDADGLWRSIMLGMPPPKRMWPYMVVTTATVIATLDSIIAGAGGAYIAARAGAQPWLIITTAAVCLVVTGLLLMLAQVRFASRLRSDFEPRFPSTRAAV